MRQQRNVCRSIAERHRRYDAQRSPRTVTTERKACDNPAQLLRTAGDPPGRCFAIIGPRRPRILGRKTIIESDEGQIELPSRLSAKRRMGVQIAKFKSTPVEDRKSVGEGKKG